MNERKDTGQEQERQPADIDWREPFEWREPAEWESQPLEELARNMLKDGHIEAGLALLANRESARQQYGWRDVLRTPPAAEHYRHTYLWDSAFFMMIYSQAALFADKAAAFLEANLGIDSDEQSGLFIRTIIGELRDLSTRFQRAGIEEGFWLIDGQRPDGFLANVQYAEGFKWYEVEKALSLSSRRRTSNYSQPPVVPLAALSVYKSMEQTGDPNAQFYLKDMYGSLAKMLGYWAQDDRRGGRDNALVVVIDPHETGMDSSRQWDYIKPFRRPRHPEMSQDEADRNRFADGGHFVIRIFERRFKAKGNLKKERQLFWANDVSMNGIYFHNIQAMIRIADTLGKTEEADSYRHLADELEQAMIEKMWQEDPAKVPKPGFYSLKSDAEPIDTITVSNLFALVLPNLPEDKLSAVLDMIDEDFNAPYPLPSDSINSPEYDPHNQEKDRLWRGPTWINTNYYLVEHGLRMQAERTDISQPTKDRCVYWAELVAQKSNELIDMNRTGEPGPAGSGAYEHYDPETGAGQRPRVINFGWTWLARLMPYKKR
jgi:hypothetical protein